MDQRNEDRDFRRFRDQGSSEALARVFDAVAPRLLLLAAHLVPDAGQAEDLVQTTFLQAMRDASRYDGRRPVGAWLAGILNHRALDHRRGAARRAAQSLGEEPAAGLDPAELVADQELFDRIVLAIEGLQSPYREVLVLRVVHGLAPTAIAHSLGRAPGTVRMQLKRGLEQLRAAMPKRSALLGSLILEPARGLDVVKQSVLAEAGALTSAAAAAGALSVGHGILGGILTMKAALIGVAALLAAIAIFSVTERSSLEERGNLEVQPAEVTLAEASAGGEPESAAPAAEDPAAGRQELEGAQREEPAPPGTLEVHVRFESDDAPAADVGVYLRPLESSSLGQEGRTDAQGHAAFSVLAPGPHTLDVDRLGRELVVGAPAREPIEVLIPRGVRVLGRVLDLEGQGVGGARVLRYNVRHHDILQLAAIADEAGHFELRDVAAGTEFIARGGGFQPSKLERVRDRGGEPDRFELVMGARGQRLRGRVLDAEGRAVPRAWIAIGVDEDAREALEGSRAVPVQEVRRKPMDLEALLLRAGDDGEFESDEVPAGFALILARPVEGDSLEIAQTSLWVRAGVTEEVTLHLRPGAEVRGVVRDADGLPVAGVELQAEWEGLPELGQMEDDLGPWMSDRRTRSAGDGTFCLSGLLAGDYDLRVQGRREELLQVERMIGEAERVRWDPVIGAFATLALRLEDPGGEPLVGWMVGATQEAGARPDWSFFRELTDAQGRKRLHDLERDAPVELSFYAPDAEARFSMLPTVVRAGVTIGPEELVLRLTPEEFELGEVSGRWLGADGRAGAEAGVLLLREGRGEALRASTGTDGSFRFTRVPAGEYRLAPGGGSRSEGAGLEPFHLAPGERRDLGEVTGP